MKAHKFGLIFCLFATVSWGQDYGEVCGSSSKAELNRELGKLQLTPCKGLDILPEALKKLVVKTTKIDKKSCFKLLRKIDKKDVVDKRDFVLWNKESQKSVDLRCTCKRVMGKNICPEKPEFDKQKELIRKAFALKASAVFITKLFEQTSNQIMREPGVPLCQPTMEQLFKKSGCSKKQLEYIDPILKEVAEKSGLLSLGIKESEVLNEVFNGKGKNGLSGFFKALDLHKEGEDNKNMTVVPAVILPQKAIEYLEKKKNIKINKKVTAKEFSKILHSDETRINKDVALFQHLIKDKTNSNSLQNIIKNVVGGESKNLSDLENNFFTFNVDDPPLLKDFKISLFSHPATSDLLIRESSKKNVTDSYYKSFESKYSKIEEIVRNKKNGFVPLIELRKDLYSAERSTRCKKIEKQVAGLCGILEKEVFFSAANLNQVEFNKQFAALGKGEYQDLKDEVESIYSGMNCMLPRLAGVVGIDEVDILISSRIGDFDSDLQGTSIPIPVIERKFREQVAKVQGLKELAERAEAAGTLTDEKREEIRTLVTGYKLPGGEPFIVPAGAKTITEQISAYEGAVAEWASRRVKGRVDEIEDEINEIARSNIPEKEKARKLDALIGEMKKLKDSGLSDRIAEKQREVRKFIDRYREDKDKVISELPIGDEKKNGTQGGSEAKERKVAGNVAGNNSQAKRGSSVRPGSNFRSNFGFSPPIDNSVNVSSGDQAVASTQKTQGAVLGRFIPREEFGDEKTRQELMVRYGELPIAVIDDKVSKFDIFSLQLENGVPTYVKKGSMSFEEAEKNGYFLTKDIRAVLEGYKEEKAGKGLESILNYMPDKSSLAKKISVLRKIQEFADAKEEMSGVRVAKTTLENLHRLLDNAIQN